MGRFIDTIWEMSITTSFPNSCTVEQFHKPTPNVSLTDTHYSISHVTLSKHDIYMFPTVRTKLWKLNYTAIDEHDYTPNGSLKVYPVQL